MFQRFALVGLLAGLLVAPLQAQTIVHEIEVFYNGVPGGPAEIPLVFKYKGGQTVADKPIEVNLNDVVKVKIIRIGPADRVLEVWSQTAFREDKRKNGKDTIITRTSLPRLATVKASQPNEIKMNTTFPAGLFQGPFPLDTLNVEKKQVARKNGKITFTGVVSRATPQWSPLPSPWSWVPNSKQLKESHPQGSRWYTITITINP